VKTKASQAADIRSVVVIEFAPNKEKQLAAAHHSQLSHVLAAHFMQKHGINYGSRIYCVHFLHSSSARRFLFSPCTSHHATGARAIWLNSFAYKSLMLVTIIQI
jgi:hypothetical protein